MEEPEARGHSFFQQHYGFEGEDWRRIEGDWLGVAGRLALQLDSDTNNTSLVLAFELTESGRVLLFPGDAQVGNWLAWEPLTWQVQEQGRTKRVTAKDLLERTVLYKVGHHGSHNATLREKGLELMTSPELVGLLPVNRAMAKKKDWKMPFPPLFTRLEERTKGRLLDVDLGVQAQNPGLLSEREWKSFISRTATAEHWLDYHVPT